MIEPKLGHQYLCTVCAVKYISFKIYKHWKQAQHTYISSSDCTVVWPLKEYIQAFNKFVLIVFVFVLLAAGQESSDN